MICHAVFTALSCAAAGKYKSDANLCGIHTFAYGLLPWLSVVMEMPDSYTDHIDKHAKKTGWYETDLTKKLKKQFVFTEFEHVKV